MDTAQLLAVVVSAVGGGGILTVIATNAFKIISGRTEKERTRNADMKTQRDEAWARSEAERQRADDEAQKRRLVQEYASRLRSDYFEAGLEPEQWPELEKTIPRNQLPRSNP